MAPWLVGMALLLALGWRLWSGLTGFAAVGSAPEVPADAAASAAKPVDLTTLRALSLFGGTAGNDAATALNTAAPTGLALRLEGVLLGSSAEASRAIIVAQGQQRTYRIGEVLPGAAGVSLRGITATRVLLDNNGSSESLALFDPAGISIKAMTTEAAAAPPTLALAGGATSLPQAAATLGEIVQVSPAQANGRLIGYRLSPGTNLKEFVRLGLQRDDIVTQVNGIALDDVSNLPRLYALMNEATEVSFSLLREGQSLTRQILLTPPR